MEVGHNLEVDVNGEKVFMVDKKVIASFSGKLRKLFRNLTGNSRKLKVIFDNFPGGGHGFELLTRFCYNNGTIEITPSNIVLLNSAAHFMEMDSNSSAKLNLVEQTEKFVEGINYWTWSELRIALKQCQDLLPATDSSFLLDKVLDCVVGRLALPNVASPFTCSSGNSSFQFSCDTSSTCSTTRVNLSSTTWWFEDLSFLNVNLFDKVIKMMVSQKLDHATIFRFIIFHLRSRFPFVTQAEKCKITEAAISLLSLLDGKSLSCKGLFHILLVASSLKKISKCYKLKLESLIGSKLDQATSDHLLVPCPHRKHYMYDVNLVLRLVKAFLLESSMSSLGRLKKVASLMDSYLIEVAADILLKPSKFAALVMILPVSARESSDRLYQAIDIYLQVHVHLSEEYKNWLCCAVNHAKLSPEALKRLAQNSMFLSRTAFKVSSAPKPKLRSSIHMNRQEDLRKILVYARRHQHSQDIDNLEAELHGMQQRVTELEKACTMMQSEMSSVTEPGSRSAAKARSLPKICS